MKQNLTRKERGAVKRLHNLSLAWPNNCWLEIDTAGVQIKRTGENGQPEIVCTVDIPTNDNHLLPHCGNCGNLLMPDERHKSEYYKGFICDGCYDLER